MTALRLVKRYAILWLCVWLVALLVVVSLVVWAILYPAQAADTGEFEDVPGAKEWFKGSVQTTCCNIADGHKGVVRRVAPGRYEAFIRGVWYPVPQTALRSDVSPWVFPVIWYSANNPCTHDGAAAPCITCLMLSGGV